MLPSGVDHPRGDAFADETPATPPEKQNTVLGQTEKKAAQDTAEQKARDAQALFEESLRQMMPLDQGQIQVSLAFG